MEYTEVGYDWNIDPPEQYDTCAVCGKEVFTLGTMCEQCSRKMHELLVGRRSCVERGIWQILADPNSEYAGWWYVDFKDGVPVCSCPDFYYRKHECKHITLLRFLRSLPWRRDGNQFSVNWNQFRLTLSPSSGDEEPSFHLVIYNPKSGWYYTGHMVPLWLSHINALEVKKHERARKI